ncbi:MAG: hypothetical protein AAF725_15005, partial [Acidobacteriota bacterium]
GIFGDSFGTATISNVAISGSGGALSLTTGTLAAAFDSLESTSGVNGVSLASTDGIFSVAGSTSLNGNTAAGLLLTSVDGADLDFGQTTIGNTTAPPIGLRASGSSTTTLDFASLFASSSGTVTLDLNGAGTVQIAGSANSLEANNSQAISIVNTAFNGTFATLSADGLGRASSAINLVRLSDPDASPALVVSQATVDNYAGGGFVATNSSGDVSILSGFFGGTSDVSGAGFPAIDINGGTGDVSISASLANRSDRGIEISGRGAGTVTLAGTLSLTGSGLNISSNTGGSSVLSGSVKTFNTGADDAIVVASSAGHTVSITGGLLDVGTTTGTAIEAAGGGVLNISGNNNTVASANGKALDISGVRTGILLTSVASTGSATQGIDLNDLLDGSALTVTGTTSVTNSGQEGIFIASAANAAIDLDFQGTTTINNPTGEAIEVIRAATNGGGTASDIDFGQLDIINRNGSGVLLDNITGTFDLGATTIANPNGAGGYGIRVEDSSADFRVASAAISNTNQTVATTDPGSDGVPDNEGDGDAIFITRMTGSFTLAGGTLSNLATDGIDFRGSADLTVTGVTINNIGTGSGNVNPTNDNGIFALDVTGNMLIRNGTISRFEAGLGQDDSGIKVLNTGVDFGEIRVDNVEFFNSFVSLAGNRGFEFQGRGTTNGNIVIENSTFRGLSGDGIGISHGNSGGGGTLDVVVRNTVLRDSDALTGAFGGMQLGVIGTAVVNANVQGTQFRDLYPSNANNGMFGTTVQEDGSLVLTVHDSDFNQTDGRLGIFLSAGNSATPTDDPDGLDFTVHGSRFSDTDDEGLLVDIRGSALNNGSPGQIRLIRNGIGDGTGLLPVGNDGFEMGATFRVRNDAKTVQMLLHENRIRNFSNSSGDESLDVDIEDSATVNATITGNFFSTISTDPTHQATLDAEDSFAIFNLAYRNNTHSEAAGSGNGSALLDNSAGATFNVSQSGNTPAPTSTGTLGSVASVTLPTGKLIPTSASIAQTASVNAAYANALGVLVLNRDGSVATGVTVSFAAPASGAGGIFPSGNTAVTDGSGIATVPLSANAVPGSFEVTASASVGGSTETAKFLLRNLE